MIFAQFQRKYLEYIPSYHCDKYSKGGRCDLCSHMEPCETVDSPHFGTSIKIHGHLRHDYAPVGKIRWFIYQIKDVPCNLVYSGSTISPTARWAQHKSKCNAGNSKSTGLSSHFIGGCPNDRGRQKPTLQFTLVDYLDTTEEKLDQCQHTPGPSCRCSVCMKFKLLEDRFILKSGSFYSQGLNTIGTR